MSEIEKFKKIIVSSFHIYNTHAFHVIYFIMDKVEHVMDDINPNLNPKQGGSKVVHPMFS